jgi:hypothetical protein
MALSRSPVRAAGGTLTALHAPELTVRAIRGDRERYRSRLSVRPVLPVRGGCVRWFWLEQAHADEVPVVKDALDHVSGQLELGDDGGRERDPAGVQLCKSDRLVAGLAQALQQPLLLDVSERHRRIGPLQRDCGRLERFQAALLALDVWRLGVWSPPTAPAAVDSRAVRSSQLTWRRCPLRRRELRARIQRAVGDQREQHPLDICREPPDPSTPASARSTPRRPTARRAAIPRPATAKQRPRTPPTRPAAAPAAINVGEPGDRRRQPARSLAGSRRRSCAGTARRARRTRPCARRADPSSR